LELTSLLSKETIEQQGFFNHDEIEVILFEHFSNKENHSAKLWLLFVFQKWYGKQV
jgi:asparagine synthase (glutamine-hydrolysing)